MEGISNLNTASVTDMRYMFGYCFALTSLDLSGWNTAAVTDMRYMFEYDSKLKDIYVDNGFVINGKDQSMFMSCKSLPNYNGSKTDNTLAHYREDGYLQLKVAQQGNSPVGAQKTGDGTLRATCDLVLDDNELEILHPFTASQVSYTRTAAAEEWQDVYVPFAVDASALGRQYEAAMVNNFHEYQQEDGSYHVELEAKPLTSGTVPACTPLLLRWKSNMGGDARLELAATEVALPPSEGHVLDCASISREYRFEGSLASRGGFSTLTDYLMHEGTLCRITDTDAQMPPYHWYLTATDIAGSTPAATPADRIAIKIVGSDTTAIKETPSMDDRQPQPIYDLQGRRLAQEPQHGVYIKNGKKYVK